MGRFAVALIIASSLAASPIVARRSLPATDGLQDARGATLGSNWTAGNGLITNWAIVVGVGARAGTCTSPQNDLCTDYWNADSFTADQYSQVVIATKGVNGFQGAVVRLDSSGNGYAVDAESGCTIFKLTAGSRSSIGSCSATFANGDTIKLKIVGSALTAYQNGAQVGSASDSTFSTGNPGIAGYVDGGTDTINNWQGDDVAGGVTLPTAIFLNNPIRCCWR